MHPENSERQIAKRGGQYLERPQRLGLMPTWSFWNRRDAWGSAKVMVAPAAGGLVALAALGAGAGAPLWSVVVGSATIYVVGLGIFERHIRRKVQQRGSRSTDLDGR
jgi:hypothetical protein